MFYKLIFNNSDKRKKIDANTSTFEGLTSYAKRIFKLDHAEVGFLFLGQDDVSAYEVTCDEDLEYVLEVSKAFSSGSKFVLIKVIENFETSPQNPNKFSRVESCLTLLDEEKLPEDSFQKLASEISRKKSVSSLEKVASELNEDVGNDLKQFDEMMVEETVEDLKEDVRNDLKQFDEMLIEEEKKKLEEVEDLLMIESIEKMIQSEEIVQIEEKEDIPAEIEKALDEQIVVCPLVEELNEDMMNMMKVDFEKEVVVVSQEQKKFEKREIQKNKKKMKKEIKKKRKMNKKKAKKVKKEMKKAKKQNKLLEENDIQEMAKKISESILLEEGEDNQEELSAKLGSILNATISQISQRFKEKKESMKSKRQDKKLRKFDNMKKKFRLKADKFNGKIKDFYNGMNPETQALAKPEYMFFGDVGCGNTDILRMERDQLVAHKFESAEKIDILSNRCLELEGELQSLRHFNQVQNREVKVDTGMAVSVETQHIGIVCDGCNAGNFKGRRFKCLICDDFDLCEKCEHQKIHSHPMIRLTSNTNKNQKLNWIIRKIRNRPAFRHIFNLKVNKEEQEQMNKRHWGKWRWMKKMFGGPERWAKHCKKRSHSSSNESSNESSSDSSNSPEKNVHHGRHPAHKNRCHRGPWGKHGRRGPPWARGGNKGPWGFPGFNGMKPFWANFQKNMCKRGNMPFAENMKCPFKNPEKKVEETKNAEDLIPKEVKEQIKKMGAEIMECYVTTNEEAPKKEMANPNEVAIQVELVNTSTIGEDPMKEDKIIRKAKRNFKKCEDKEDFKIVEEKPKEMTEEEKEISNRKEYMKSILHPQKINEEILHFFVINNLDLDMNTFYRLIEEQKAYLLK